MENYILDTRDTNSRKLSVYETLVVLSEYVEFARKIFPVQTRQIPEAKKKRKTDQDILF